MTTQADVDPSLILKPFNKDPHLNTATVLVIGAEGTGKHVLAKYMVVANQQKINLQIRTATQLPLPTENESARPRIDFICFVVDLTNRDSMKTCDNSIKYVDGRYFLGRACVVATKVKYPQKRSIHIETLTEFANSYGMSILYGGLEKEVESITLAKKILKLTEIAAGLVKNVSPLWLMSTKNPF